MLSKLTRHHPQLVYSDLVELQVELVAFLQELPFFRPHDLKNESTNKDRRTDDNKVFTLVQ